MSNPNPSPETRFKKGQSGNPGGRSTKLQWMKKILGEDFDEQLLKKAYDMALHGKREAMEMFVTRLIPPVPTDEPTTELDVTHDDPIDKGKEILLAVSEGRITLKDANTMFSSLTHHMKIVETADLLKRIEELEKAKK